MASDSMKNNNYHCCVLCGKKRVAPTNQNPLKYPKYSACPACSRLKDFEERMDRYKEKVKGLRYANTSSP